MAVQTQKLKTLYLMQILLERTDEDHLLNASELCHILEQEYAMHTDRRTIYSEIDTLDKFGLDIVQKKGKNPGYYIASRQFELPELKLLVDAVQSSKFITEKKSGELIKKLENLCSRAEAKTLSKQVSISNRPKTDNETIYYNVDQIHSAIYKNRKISFQYVEWTMQKEIHYKKNGGLYIISPWALTWNDENYYLVAYDENTGQMKHYRVDKMRNMKICGDERNGKEAFQNFHLAEFAKKTFGMYGGRDVEVLLYCHKKLSGVVLDRFGQDTWMIPADEEHFKAKVFVSVSRQFFGWVAGVGSQMKIMGPEDVREEYKEYLEEILSDY